MSDFAITPLFKQVNVHGSTTYLLYDHQDGTATFRKTVGQCVIFDKLLNVKNYSNADMMAGFILLCQVV